MNDTTENPRAVVGGNNPPLSVILKSFAVDENFSATIADYLKEEYAPFIADAANLLDEARALPRPIKNKEDRELWPPLVKRMRDLKGKLEAFHKKEGEPFLRGKQACDQVLFGVIDRLARRSKENKAGGADVLLAELTDYDNRILAEEKARRELEAAEAARVARAAQIKADAEAREAEERRIQAERARAPAQIEAKQEAAQEAEQAASVAQVEATVTLAKAEEAHIQTLAKSSDIMRERSDDGWMSTMAEVKYAEIEDRTKLDLAKLARFLPIKALEQALTAWARNTDYREEMPGAKVGRRNKTRVL